MLQRDRVAFGSENSKLYSLSTAPVGVVRDPVVANENICTSIADLD
jgi:hypothetical protein